MSRPYLGSESFMQMAALAMAGQLASCRSCVEHFYFQSLRNASAFLDSCAAGGLVEKVSLLYLHGDVGVQSDSGRRQRWYDESIYISAPAYRSHNLDAARKRIEGTKNAVYIALNLYHEILDADDKAINSAYARAVRERKLRHSDIAEERKDVALSPVAKLRLIQDGFRHDISKGDSTLPRAEVERLALEQTADYVLGTPPDGEEEREVSDRTEELQQFVLQFLENRRALAPYWPKGFGEIPEGYHQQLLPVISELVRYCRDLLTERGDMAGARRFDADVRARAESARAEESSNSVYANALSEFLEDLESPDFDADTPVSALSAGQAGRASEVRPV